MGVCMSCGWVCVGVCRVGVCIVSVCVGVCVRYVCGSMYVCVRARVSYPWSD